MLLEVSHLTVCYDKAMLINDLSMGVDQGELVSTWFKCHQGIEICTRSTMHQNQWIAVSVNFHMQCDPSD